MYNKNIYIIEVDGLLNNKFINNDLKNLKINDNMIVSENISDLEIMNDLVLYLRWYNISYKFYIGIDDKDILYKLIINQKVYVYYMDTFKEIRFHNGRLNNLTIIKIIQKIVYFEKENGNKNPIEVYTHGKCYVFANKLRDLIGGEIYYIKNKNHFVLLYNTKLYDITGNVTKKYNNDIKILATELSEKYMRGYVYE